MSGPLRGVRRRLAARVSAAYADPPPVTCEAYGGPCDGRSWKLPGRVGPIWLAGVRGQRHLYVPEPGGPAVRVRYRYAASYQRS